VTNLIKSLGNKDGIAGRFVGDEVISVLESQQGECLSGSFPRGPVIEGWAQRWMRLRRRMRTRQCR
jgi:hypothetical protein